MEGTSIVDMKNRASAIGVLVDRVLSREDILGTVWLVDKDKVATSAHLMVLYAEYLSALKVRFPVAGKEYGIAQVSFHPHFKRKLTAEISQDLLARPQTSLPLKKYNACVLTITQELDPLSADEALRLNQKLSLPLLPRDQGLGGNLSEIDLALVIQTINNARREGILIISDERNRPIARLFCQDGRLMYALYKNLANEAAVYQMVRHNISGNFFFTARVEPDWEVQRAITRPTDMLLIEAHRRLDEFTKIGAFFGGGEAILIQAKSDLNLDVLPPELKEQAILIWSLLDGTTAAGRLWQLANTDDYTIFSVLSELAKTRQVVEAGKHDSRLSSDKNSGAELSVLPLSINSGSSLAPWDRLDAIVIDPASAVFRFKSGALLGALRPSDPYHLVHNLSLLPEATGAPLFRNGSVVGMHSGALPADPQATDGNIQQMLWAQAIVECLNQESVEDARRHVTLAGESMMPHIQDREDKLSIERFLPGKKAGCKEVARIDCPRCGSSHLDSARFCKSCGKQLIQDIEVEDKEKPRTKVLLVLIVLFMLAISIPTLAWFTQPRPYLVEEPLIVLPAKPWVDVSLHKAKVHGSVNNVERVSLWEEVPKNTPVKKHDVFHIKIKANESAFVYVIYKGSGDKVARLIYPNPNVKKGKDVLLNAGATFTLPEKIVEMTNGKLWALGITPNGPEGDDIILVMASRSPARLLNEKAGSNNLAEAVLAVFNQGRFDNGIEMYQETLGKNLFDKDKPLGKQKRKPVYFQLLKITHD